MKYRLLLLFSCFLCGPVIAQDRTAQTLNLTDPGYKAWSDGPLSEEDFQHRRYPDMNGRRSSLKAFWEFNSVRKNIDGVRVLTFEPETYMDRLSSWIVTDDIDDMLLLHNQNVFDLHKLAGERLSRDIIRFFDQEDIVSYYNRRIGTAIDEYLNESDQGRDIEVVTRFHKNLEESLARLEDQQDTIPYFHKGFGISFFLGYTGELYSQSLNQFFSMTNGANIGFELYFGPKSFLLFSINGGGSGALKNTGISIDGYDWRVGEKVDITNINLSFGRRIAESPRMAISPFAGIGVSMLSQGIPEDLRPKEDHYTSDISSFAVLGGLQFDWFLLRRMDLRHFMPEYDEFPLTVRAYISRINLTSIGPGWTFNIGLSMALRPWFINQKGLL